MTLIRRMTDDDHNRLTSKERDALRRTGGFMTLFGATVNFRQLSIGIAMFGIAVLIFAETMVRT